MSVEKAIQRLKEEITIKEMTVEVIENFNNIDICDQLKAIKNSDLRYCKEFRENWAKGILNYAGYIKIESNSNGITVMYPLHTLFVPTHNSNGVVFEESREIREPIIPDDKNKKLFESRIEATENYKNTPSFKNFKKVLVLGATGAKPLLWWFDRDKAMQTVIGINSRTHLALRNIESAWKEYRYTLDKNSKVMAERERIKKELEKDFAMFEQNNLKVYKRC